METVETNGNGSSELLSFLTGLGTGIALTLLLAPLSGAATRSLIGRRVKGGEKWIKNKAAKAEDYIIAQGAELRDRVNELANGGNA